jgi:hypothetical protein
MGAKVAAAIAIAGGGMGTAPGSPYDNAPDRIPGSTSHHARTGTPYALIQNWNPDAPAAK